MIVMKTVFSILAWSSFAILLVNFVRGEEKEEKKEKYDYKWSTEMASLDYCVKKHLADCEVEREKSDGLFFTINILSKPDKKLIYSFKGHTQTVFARHKD